MAFSFGFQGDDIEADSNTHPLTPKPASTTTAASAFPVVGKPQLPAKGHRLTDLLAALPSKIAYDCLDVELEDGTTVKLPRRELWDVRVQLMAEDEAGEGAGEGADGLGQHDVKTGVYEGGFKSWESSVDLVKVLASAGELSFEQSQQSLSLRFVELGCGTALPSLALFQQAGQTAATDRGTRSFVVADYNPTVLQLVTLPNFILTWALKNAGCDALKDAWSMEGELELSVGVIQAFQDFLKDHDIQLHFLSGGWSPDFVHLLDEVSPRNDKGRRTLIVGAETIYSPFALKAFSETVVQILADEKANSIPGFPATALVGAKRLYFGVGGSLDDFIVDVEQKGARVQWLRDEAAGVRRGVIRVTHG